VPQEKAPERFGIAADMLPEQFGIGRERVCAGPRVRR
jgi:hypothetical protein